MAEGSGGFLIIFPSPFRLLSPSFQSSPLSYLAACPNSSKEVNQQQSPSCQPFNTSKAVLGAGLDPAPCRDFWGPTGWWEWRSGSDHNSTTDKGNILLHCLWHFKHFSWFTSAHARYPPLLLAQLFLVGSLSLMSALIDKCQLPQMPRSWQHWLPGSLLLHKVNEDSGYSCQDPGSHVIPWRRAVSPLSQAPLKVFSLVLGSWDGRLRTTQKAESGVAFGGSACWRGRHERTTCPWTTVHISIKLWGHRGLASDDTVAPLPNVSWWRNSSQHQMKFDLKMFPSSWSSLGI